MDSAAEKNGFIVAYLNGTRATRSMGADKLGWNAGGRCCGQPAINNVDDVGYIEGAVDYLAANMALTAAVFMGWGVPTGP